MSPETMIYELQRIWDNSDYKKKDFEEYVLYYVEENDTSPFGCVFDEQGYAYPVSSYVLNALNLQRK